MKSKSHDHYANQQKPTSSSGIAKPSPSTSRQPGVTAPLGKPSPSTGKKPGVTGPKC
jgi:hypothetical protein